ncbi:hypothetical protein DP939_42365 [Spongiactinospora rosea]|uniref:Uncharacterized protein n=1 Tax=Spongiactinospora rosea TaxID=2248750 RepID=A0A366LJS1_9ACTN|nr:hypothetical protein DP939_42365 [Spongiactinospora rosea]
MPLVRLLPWEPLARSLSSTHRKNSAASELPLVVSSESSSESPLESSESSHSFFLSSQVSFFGFDFGFLDFLSSPMVGVDVSSSSYHLSSFHLSSFLSSDHLSSDHLSSDHLSSCFFPGGPGGPGGPAGPAGPAGPVGPAGPRSPRWPLWCPWWW